MQLRTMIIGMLALVFGVSAAMGVYLVSSQAPTKVGQVEMASIVFVTTNVGRGTSLTEEVVALREWPKAHIPKGALTSLEDVVDRSVSIPMLQDEPVVESKLAAKGSGRGMAALIPPGKRAVTIQTPNVATGMAGFILPGDAVDVLVTLSYSGQEDASGGSGTLTLLQNVEVLAVDQRIEAPSENVVDMRELRSVTLLVTPAEATRLNLGQNKGTLSLSLRNPADQELGNVETATLTSLRNPSAAALEASLATTAGDLDEFIGQAIGKQSEKSVIEPVGLMEPTQDEPPSGPSSLPPIRTLRGNTSGTVYLRPVVTYY